MINSMDIFQSIMIFFIWIMILKISEVVDKILHIMIHRDDWSTHER